MRKRRERLRKAAAAGDKEAYEKLHPKTNLNKEGFSRAKTFIRRHATSEQLNELEELIKKVRNNA